ncbi:GMC oxidoreductase [Xylariaceae sp. AK1471]|nr:GMC oxidoreductase [Xylariaceae sp. AK1471]
MSVVFDFIVVGGGTAGLALASRLSENSKIQVLVIEAGEDLTADPRVTLPAMSQSLLNTPSDWNLQTAPQSMLGGRQLKIPGGRVLGGSSAINAFMFTPTSKAHVNAWAGLGNPGWEWLNFSQSMAKAYSVSDSPWGSIGEGPIHVSFADEKTQWPTVWRETICALGIPSSLNPFSGEFYGAYMTPESVHPATKFRSYSGSAYLEPARSHSNLTVWTQISVDKVIFDKTSDGDILATGVQYTTNDIAKTVHARKEVILSAGALFTPQILELSGIGDPSILQPLGIDTVIDNPHVGENLQNHTFLGITYDVSEEEGKDPLTGSATISSAQMPLPCFSTEKGRRELDELLENSRAQIDPRKATPEFVKAHESFVHSVLASPTDASALYYLFPEGLTIEGNGMIGPPHPGTDHYLAIGVSLAHPLSRGSTHITSASASPPGLSIDPGYLSNPLDVEVLARHVQQVEEMSRTQPLAKQLVRREKRFPEAGDLSDLEVARQFVRETSVGAYHWAGTCAMMPRDLGGVIDEKLRVYGCKNLRVCDLSVVPIVPRGNTQATAYGIAEHAAKIIQSDL